jgi:hypothetical protein
MRQDEKVSRYEVNRNVRMVFARHDADLTRIDYSFMGTTVYFNGDLVRTNGDFSAQEIESIAREISALPHVRDMHFDLNNWVVASSGDSSWQVNRSKKAGSIKGTANQAGSSDATVVIKKTEELQDVLADLKANLKTKD